MSFILQILLSLLKYLGWVALLIVGVTISKRFILGMAIAIGEGNQEKQDRWEIILWSGLLALIIAISILSGVIFGNKN